jgi:D-beta-D-heptose 7-phosphate kinase/D-beta-D-heptose 1-phosphate adenosyltransferase
MRTVAISGGFDPLHLGHVNLIRDAFALGDRLQIYLNQDWWLVKKKGYCLLPIEVRMEIAMDVAQAYSEGKVFGVIPVIDEDMTVCKTLETYKPDVFANGGDRKDPFTVPEFPVCKKLGIEMVYGIGGYDKAGSSSDYFIDAMHQYLNNRGYILSKVDIKKAT